MHIDRRRRSSSPSAESTSGAKRHRSSPLTSAPSAPAAAAVPAADTMQVMNDDMILCIATFASCQDLCVLGRVCRRFSPLPFHEDIWELRALDILPSLPELRSAMDALKLNSCRQLIEAFTRIGIPGGVLGFWQAEASAAPPGEHLTPTLQELEARGELLRITLEAGGFLCESIAPNGTRRRIFTIRVSKTSTDKIKIGFFSLEKESSLTVGGEDDRWVPGDSMAEALTRYTLAVPSGTERTPIRASGARAFLLEREDGRIRRYAKLTAPKPPPATCPTALPSAATGSAGVEHLCGLWCAPYGSHGLEIIQLSTEPSSSPSAGAAEAAAAAAATAAVAATAAAAAEAEKAAKACCGSPTWCAGEGAGSSCGMTEDGNESVCTSAPATDGEDRSEAGSCFGDGGGGWANASAGSDDDGGSDDDDDDSDHDCPTVMSKSATITAKKKKMSCRQGSPVAHQPSVSAAKIKSKNDDPVIDSPAQLFGFKVTGDDNVPAGKTSFVIDLTTEFDVDDELRSDSRPLVMFLPSGAVMANLANRREQISRWRKGRGQINCVPGRWSPEWVDVEFVEYRAGSRCAFSVIFRQPTQAVRVVMNFERALGAGRKEEWPRWSSAAAATVDPFMASVVSSA